MLAILNSLNAHYFTIFQPNLMILVSKFIVHRAFSDKTYLSLGLLSHLSICENYKAVSKVHELDYELSRGTRYPTMWYLASVDSDEPEQPPFKLRNSKWRHVTRV